MWPDCPIEVASLLFFDIERSGLRPDRGGRIAGIAVLDGSGIWFWWGCTADDTTEPDTSEQLSHRLSDLTKGIVVGHNVTFGLRIVAYVADRLGHDGPGIRFVDTLALARQLLQPEDYRLSSLLRFLDIFVVRDVRIAVVDARATCALFWVLVDRGTLETLSDTGMKRLDWRTF
jgi:DNA polymerase III epsilon subunit-like protein